MTNFTIKKALEDYQGNSKENIRIALDLNNEYLGSGYVYNNINTEVSPDHPVNIYIDINMLNEKDLGNDVSLELFKQLRVRAIEVRKDYPQYRAHFYYGCRSEKQEKLDFFLSRGFVRDEGTLLLEMDLSKYPYTDNPLEDITIKDNHFEDKQAMNTVIALHNKILFRSLDQELLENFNQLLMAKHFTAYDKHEIVGHIMLYVKKDAQENLTGIIENLFVVKDWRNKKIAKHLVDSSMMYFKTLNINQIQLEVWSINKVAYNFYMNLGFKLVKETEIYVGEYI